MKKIVSIVLLLWVMSIHAQEKIPFVDSEKIFTQVNEAAQKGDYQASVDYLSQIHPSDSVYLTSLKDKTYYLLQLKKYKEAIEMAEIGINSENPNESKSTFYINKAVGLLELKKYEEASIFLDEAIKKYPVESLLYYNKGVALGELGKNKEAMEAIQESLFYAPFYASAHLKLGNLCYRRGLFAQSLMAFNMYLLMDYENDPFQILKSLNEVVKGKFPKRSSNAHENFENLDLILNSHIALNKGYTIDNEIPIALNKQNHALLSEVTKLNLTDDFWGKRYIPLFQWIQNNNYYNDFTYAISSSIRNPEYKKVIEKNSKKIEAFLPAFYTKWTRLIEGRTLIQDGKEVLVYYSYNNDDEAIAYGPKDEGLWHYFYDSSELKAVGTYDENEDRIGTWTWYFKNGQVDETTKYSKGKMEGESLAYYTNGQLKVDSRFKESKFDGKYELYTLGGALNQRKYFRNGYLQGPYRSYFAVGELIPEYAVEYNGDTIVGSLLEYYSNGKVYRESVYKDGQLHQEKDFYLDGSIWAERNYRDSQLSGSYKLFYKNKQVAEEGQAKNGSFDGAWKTYFVNGQIDREFTYDEGKLAGTYKAYGIDGKLHYNFTYRNGELIAYTYYDKEGNVLKEAKKKGGEFEYEGYNANGSLSSKGLYDVSGGRKGPWSFYSEYGVLTEQGTYVENQPHGEYTYFFDGGAVKTKLNFDHGVQTGYFVDYYINGKMKQQGWYKNGLSHGEWKYYHKDGSLSAISYYHKGKKHGVYKDYSVEGKLATDIHFEFGKRTKEVVHDVHGKSHVFFDLYDGSGEEIMTNKYQDGSIQTSFSYINKVKHGPYKRYSFTGDLLEEATYHNNELNGNYRSYYDHGEINSDFTYFNGNLDGEQKTYYEGGTLAQLHFYNLGEEHGKGYSYYENGVVSHDREHIYGKIHGKYKFFDISGKLQLIRHYEYGELIGYSYHDTNGKEVEMIPLKHGSGKVKAYYDNGKVSREMEFFNGKLVNTYKAYYYDGTPENEIQFIEGEYNSVVTEYHSNGKIKTEKNFLLGNQHGSSREYYDNGQLKSSENYLSDTKTGEAKYYSKKGKLTKEVTYANGTETSVKKY